MSASSAATSNYPFRYTAEENLVTAAELELVEAILQLPIDEAIELTYKWFLAE